MDVGIPQEKSGSRPKRYESLASEITGWIDAGTFRAGDRLPSVRRLSHQSGASVTTVLAAYRQLEDRGVVEARPQSGYYVRARLVLPEPGLTSPARDPATVEIDDFVLSLLRENHRIDLFQLGSGHPNPKLLPNDRLRRAMTSAAKRLPASGNFYTPPEGLETLRVQIARRALAAGLSVGPDEIVVTSGATEALHLALRSTCEPGDAVAIESPTYFGILQAIDVLGLRAVEVRTHPRLGMDVDSLREALGCCTIKACVVVTNFQNPLGALMPDARKRELISTLESAGVTLIEDDVYGELGFGAERPRVVKAFESTNSTLVCSSFSKTLAPGYRVGWVIPGIHRAKVARLKFATSVTTPTLPQLAISDFLEDGGYDRYLRKVRRAYARNVELMIQAIARHFPEGSRVARPAGSYFVWVELPARVDALDLRERALERGITVMPGPIFSPRRRYRNFLRLSASYWDPSIEQGLSTLGQLAHELAGRC